MASVGTAHVTVKVDMDTWGMFQLRVSCTFLEEMFALDELLRYGRRLTVIERMQRAERQAQWEIGE